MNFDLKRPCPHCPFRTDIPGYLRRERAGEIAQSLQRDGNFPCHKTIDHDDDGEYVPKQQGEQACAGAMILMERMNRPNQLMRIAERLGQYDPSKLDMDAPVHLDFDSFITHHGDDDEEMAETCSVVGPGCMAPAGWMEGGNVVHNYDVDPEDMTTCKDCGEPVCLTCEDDCYCKS